MHQHAFIALVLAALLPYAQAQAVSAKDKMETCKFGADDQKLQGAARESFLKKCMANKNDPRGPAAPAAAGASPKS